MTAAPDDAALLERPDVARLARAVARRPSLQLEPDDRTLARQAATALVLRPRTDDALELLFIKRAEWAGDPWSGQVAFPGGRHEPHDPDLLTTSVRETQEETGIDLAADTLQQMGYDKVQSMAGGWRDWVAAGGKVEG